MSLAAAQPDTVRDMPNVMRVVNIVADRPMDLRSSSSSSSTFLRFFLWVLWMSPRRQNKYLYLLLLSADFLQLLFERPSSLHMVARLGSKSNTLFLHQVHVICTCPAAQHAC
jgi:hypothetical protein